MSEYRARVLAECKLVEDTLALLQETLDRPALGKPEWMAAAGFIFNVYSGIENILKNACRARNIPLPTDSPSSHRDLIETAFDSGLVGKRLRNDLDEYRGFRHVFAHGYGVMLDPEQLAPLATRLPAVWRQFRKKMLSGL